MTTKEKLFQMAQERVLIIKKGSLVRNIGVLTFGTPKGQYTLMEHSGINFSADDVEDIGHNVEIHPSLTYIVLKAA